MKGLIVSTGVAIAVVGSSLLATGIGLMAQGSERTATLIFDDCFVSDIPNNISGKDQDCPLIYETADGQFIVRTVHVVAGEAVPRVGTPETVDQRADGVWSPSYQRRRTVYLALIVSGALLLTLGLTVGYLGYRTPR